MAVNKVVYRHFEVKVSPAAAHAVDALLFGCGKIDNDLNPNYNADLVNSVAFRASECTITRVVRKNADDESTVLYDGTPVNHFYLEYEPEDENDNGLFSITVKKSDGTDAMKVVTVPYGTNRRPVYATQDEALRARMTTAEDDIDALETRMTQAEDDIDDLEQQVEQAETDIANLEQQVEAIQQKDAGQDEKIEALESATAGTSEMVGTLQENYNVLNERVWNIGTTVMSNTQAISNVENDLESVNALVSDPLKFGFPFNVHQGSPVLLSPYTLGKYVDLSPDQIEGFGFGETAVNKLGWSEFAIKPVLAGEPPHGISFFWIRVTFNVDMPSEVNLGAMISGELKGDEMIVWKFIRGLNIFVPYFKSSFTTSGREFNAIVDGNITPAVASNVQSIRINSGSSENLTFNGGFSLSSYDLGGLFTS